jgi:hypothetical protein
MAGMMMELDPPGMAPSRSPCGRGNLVELQVAATLEEHHHQRQRGEIGWRSNCSRVTTEVMGPRAMPTAISIRRRECRFAGTRPHRPHLPGDAGDGEQKEGRRGLTPNIIADGACQRAHRSCLFGCWMLN